MPASGRQMSSCTKCSAILVVLRHGIACRLGSRPPEASASQQTAAPHPHTLPQPPSQASLSTVLWDSLAGYLTHRLLASVCIPCLWRALAVHVFWGPGLISSCMLHLSESVLCNGRCIFMSFLQTGLFFSCCNHGDTQHFSCLTDHSVTFCRRRDGKAGGHRQPEGVSRCPEQHQGHGHNQHRPLQAQDGASDF